LESRLQKTFAIDVTDYANSKSNEWTIKVEPSLIQFQQDQLNERSASVMLMMYDQSVPTEEWDTELGLFIDWSDWLSYDQKKAAISDITYLGLSGYQIRLNDYAQPEGRKVFVGVTVYQNSPGALNIEEGFVVLGFEKNQG
jgi:hypothetical protein